MKAGEGGQIENEWLIWVQQRDGSSHVYGKKVKNLEKEKKTQNKTMWTAKYKTKFLEIWH